MVIIIFKEKLKITAFEKSLTNRILSKDFINFQAKKHMNFHYFRKQVKLTSL